MWRLWNLCDLVKKSQHLTSIGSQWMRRVCHCEAVLFRWSNLPACGGDCPRSWQPMDQAPVTGQGSVSFVVPPRPIQSVGVNPCPGMWQTGERQADLCNVRFTNHHNHSGWLLVHWVYSWKLSGYVSDSACSKFIQSSRSLVVEVGWATEALTVYILHGYCFSLHTKALPVIDQLFFPDIMLIQASNA